MDRIIDSKDDLIALMETQSYKDRRHTTDVV